MHAATNHTKYEVFVFEFDTVFGLGGDLCCMDLFVPCMWTVVLEVASR
jgi:hypothetical protein